MKIEEPTLNGESTDANHTNEIEILSFEQTVSRPPTGGGNEGQKTAAQMTPILLFKQLDKSTPKLLEAANKGTIYNKVTLGLCQPSGTADVATSQWKKIVYFQVTLEKVQISSIRWIGDPSLHYTSIPGDAGPVEEIQLAFRKISWMYKGGTGTANISGSWNLNNNAPT
ncbi:MAG: type VI secretion system tube protein Hcp [Planctomycetales bacterium]|nr:type VI secretion system tube protein Hcp [Planctomycetales bacterium]